MVRPSGSTAASQPDTARMDTTYASITHDHVSRMYAQCVRSLAALILWFYPQALAALPTLGALGVLVRYRMRGNTRLPSIGMMIFAANVVLSAALLWYISTLPMEFR